MSRTRYLHYSNPEDPGAAKALCGKNCLSIATPLHTMDIRASAALIITKGKDLKGFATYLKNKRYGGYPMVQPCPACLEREELIILAETDLE